MLPDPGSPAPPVRPTLPVRPLPRRRPGSTDPGLFHRAASPDRRLRLARTFYSCRTGPQRRGRRDSFTWFGGRGGLPRLVVLAVAALLGVTGCSSGEQRGGGGQQVSGTAGSDRLSLKGVCPDTVVVQASWFPQVEHSAVYQLVGAGYRIDAAKKTVTGPLVASGRDTGVSIQVRAGGPAIGYQQVSAQMAADRSITLGMVPSDELVQQSKLLPLLGVVAPLELDPQVIMWDPRAHPDWQTIADIGQTNVPVLYFQNLPFMDYLLGAGILRKSQVDPSYNGAPDRFIASRGQIAVQGYATNEPYAWEHEVSAWGKPLSYALINDTGYPNYSNVLAIRPDDRGRLDGCLRRLVPIIQRAQVDFMAKPAATTELIVRAVAAQKGFTYTKALADYAVKTMREQGIVDNGRDRTLGEFDDARLDKLINILTPIFAGQRKPIRDGLTHADLATNDYIDPSVGLPASR